MIIKLAACDSLTSHRASNCRPADYSFDLIFISIFCPKRKCAETQFSKFESVWVSY